MEKRDHSKTMRQAVEEPRAAYGDTNSLKARLVDHIMRRDEAADLKEVPGFVEKREASSQASFAKEWERALTVDQFQARCLARLKEIYG